MLKPWSEWKYRNNPKFALESAGIVEAADKADRSGALITGILSLDSPAPALPFARISGALLHNVHTALLADLERGAHSANVKLL